MNHLYIKTVKPVSTFLICILCTLGAFTQQPHFVKKGNQVFIHLINGTLLLQAFSDSVIRVAFSAGDKIPVKNEIAVIKAPQKVSYKVHEKNRVIYLQTNVITARVGVSGTVAFFDNQGNLLLSELPGSRKLAPTNDHGEATYAPEQGFIAADEALYGLGQYQNGLINWKNTPLRFKQFNQQDAVPFLVSSRGYGILWNNYSVTDFNPCDKEIHFTSVVDSQLNIRKAKFTPTQTGIYCFAVESLSPKENRFKGPIVLTINGDTVIHYNTVWVPEFQSGKINLQGGKTYQVVIQNSNAQTLGRVLYNEPDYNKTVFKSRIGELVDYYFVYGKSLAGVIANYRWLTGDAPLFGKWAYGFWQCRERYSTQNELLENAKEYRKREIAVDNIVQDWNYWPDSTWGPEWNRKKYPNPAVMISQLKDMHFHLMVSVWPRIDNKKLEAKYNLTDHKIDSKSGNLDLWDPMVRKNYYQMVKDSMFNIGVNSIWLDGTEPENYEPDAHTSKGSFNKVALTYPMVVTQALYEGHRQDFPDKRVFNLTRSAFAGMQRYGAAYWSGDISGTWDQFKQQITGGLNFSMAGLPYWTTDIGGFFRDQNSLNTLYDSQYTNREYKELLTRWFEFGAFCPLFRIHGYKSNTEVWRYGQDFENIARKYIDLRYQLMPYIYSMAADVTRKGDIMMKPLVHDYPVDKNTWNIKDQFLFGSSILVNPVTNYNDRSRKVYLPQGDWYNFWTAEKKAGGKTITVAASIDQMPLFVKAGAIIPVGPKVQYAMQEIDEPLCIFIYPGKDGSYELYEDEGENYGYEKGAFSVIPFHWNDVEKTLLIGKRKGSFNNIKESRRFKIVLVQRGKANGLESKTFAALVNYTGQQESIKRWKNDK